MSARKIKILFGATIALLACAAPDLVSAASVSGTVLDQEARPVPGALVTVFSGDKKRKETVYTDAAGRYSIRTDFVGRLSLRARAIQFQDSTRHLEVADERTRGVDFKLSAFATAQAHSDSLSASAHAATLPWHDTARRAAFVNQCNYCHQMGNSLTRTPRDESAWRQTIRRMEGYLAMVTDKEADYIAEVLAKGFTGKPVNATQSRDAGAELAQAKVSEWLLGDGMSFIHDMDVGEDGKFYGADEGHDLLWVLDRQSGKVEKYPQPDIDLPVGGRFSGMALPIGVFSGKHGPHSMAQAKDGRFWITNALSSTLMSFDPKTKEYKTYPIGNNALYPHTIRIDGEGIVWFTILASNQVGRFDPKTEKMSIVKLPANGFWRWMTDTFFPVVLKVASWANRGDLTLTLSQHKWANQGREIMNSPYGIDVNPKDGTIWYAKLHANKIGRIDPKTMAVTEFDTPMRGPRRPRFDKNGVLWIPAFDDGGLMRFDTATAKFETYKLPTLAKNEYEVPYALNVHPKTGDVWITANMSDRVLRFTPATKAFVSYPVPTRVSVHRDLAFTDDGLVCSSSSNLPAYAIEDQVPSFICIDPVGGERDRQALTKSPPSSPVADRSAR